MHDPTYPIQNVAFPAVSICSNNRISNKAAKEYAHDLYVETLILYMILCAIIYFLRLFVLNFLHIIGPKKTHNAGTLLTS